MLGKHRYRAGRFSILRALVLFVFICLAQVIGPGIRAPETGVSDMDQAVSDRVSDGQTGVIRVQAVVHKTGEAVQVWPGIERADNRRAFGRTPCHDGPSGARDGLT